MVESKNKTAPLRKGRPKKAAEEPVAAELKQVEAVEHPQGETLKEETVAGEALVVEEEKKKEEANAPAVEAPTKEEEAKAEEPTKAETENKPKRTPIRYDFYGVSWNGVEYDL